MFWVEFYSKLFQAYFEASSLMRGKCHEFISWLVLNQKNDIKEGAAIDNGNPLSQNQKRLEPKVELAIGSIRIRRA